MLAYLKLKSTNEELYESDFLNRLKQKNTKFAKMQYLLCYFFYEWVVWIKYYANIITVKQIYHGYLFILPFSLSKNKNNYEKMQKCMKKVKRLVIKYQIHSFVLSDELKESPEWKENNMANRKVHLLDGRGLMPYLLKEVLEYMIEKQDSKMQLEDLYICVKEVQNICIENIAYLSQYFRTTNIITPKINNFQKQAEKIEEKQNVLITVTNNKKKSLKKAKYIINFDFNIEELKKYTIYRKAILLSLKEEKYEQTGFEGIQIFAVGIDTAKEVKEFFTKYHLLESCSLETLYESIINKKQNLSTVKAQMQKDQIRILKLYGRRGEISEREYKDIAS